jgi:hypothetical protein
MMRECLPFVDAADGHPLARLSRLIQPRACPLIGEILSFRCAVAATNTVHLHSCSLDSARTTSRSLHRRQPASAVSWHLPKPDCARKDWIGSRQTATQSVGTCQNRTASQRLDRPKRSGAVQFPVPPVTPVNWTCNRECWNQAIAM